MATTKLPRQLLTGNLYTALSSSATTVLDFSGGWTIGVLDGLATNTTVSTLSLAAGSTYGLRIKDNGVARTLTFPGTWTWLTTPPATTTVSKWVLITLECLNADTPVILADWKLADTAATLAEYQPLDTDLTAISALTTTTFGRSLLTPVDAAATRTLIGAAQDSAVVHLAGAEDVAGAKRFTTTVTIDRGTGTLPSDYQPARVALRLASADGFANNIESHSYQALGTQLIGRTYGGTRASPAATPANSNFVGIVANGHDGSTYPSEAGGFYTYAPSAWSGTSREVGFAWYGTSAASTARALWATMVNGDLAVGGTPTAGAGKIQSSGPIRIGQYTVATLPAAGFAGRIAFATNGRKNGEGGGAGTGVQVYDDGTAWRRVSDDSTVAA